MGDEHGSQQQKPSVTVHDAIQYVIVRIMNEVNFSKANEVLALCHSVESLVRAQCMQETAIRELAERDRERLA